MTGCVHAERGDTPSPEKGSSEAQNAVLRQRVITLTDSLATLQSDYQRVVDGIRAYQSSQDHLISQIVPNANLRGVPQRFGEDSAQRAYQADLLRRLAEIVERTKRVTAERDELRQQLGLPASSDNLGISPQGTAGLSVIDRMLLELDLLRSANARLELRVAEEHRGSDSLRKELERLGAERREDSARREARATEQYRAILILGSEQDLVRRGVLCKTRGRGIGAIRFARRTALCSSFPTYGFVLLDRRTDRLISLPIVSNSYDVMTSQDMSAARFETSADGTIRLHIFDPERFWMRSASNLVIVAR